VADKEHKYEITIPGVGKHVVSMAVPDDASDDEIHNSLSQYVDDYSKQATATPPAPKPPIPSGLQGPDDTPNTMGWMRTGHPGLSPSFGEPPSPNESADLKENEGRSKGVLKVASGAVSMAGGMPWWIAGLNAATANNPADLATAAAGAFGIPALNKIKQLQSANRFKNILFGIGKGVGSYESLSRGHALLNGDPQQPLNPFKSAPISDMFPFPSDVAGLGLSGLAGGVQGAIEAPTPLSDEELKAQAYDKYKRAMDLHKAAEKEASGEFKIHDDKVTALNEKLTQGSVGDKNTFGQFKREQGAYKTRLDSLDQPISDAKAATVKAANDTEQFKKTLAGGQDYHTGRAADDISDQILAEQKRLDDLKNPDKAPALISNHPGAQAIQKEIDRLEAIDTSKYNAGQKATVDKALERNRQALDDFTEGTGLRDEIDASNNRIRVLKDLRRRVESGRAPGNVASTPEDIAQAQDEAMAQNKALGGLQARQTESERSLAELNQKYRDIANQRLQHAQTHPGATVASQADIEAQQKAMDLRAAARAKMAEAKSKQDLLEAAALRAGHAEPPKKGTMDAALDYVGKIGKKVMLPAIGAAGLSHGHDANPFMSLGPALGGGLGIAADLAARSETGRKILAFLNNAMSPAAASTIPATVNQISNDRNQK
jgi:hypothetical protein